MYLHDVKHVGVVQYFFSQKGLHRCTFADPFASFRAPHLGIAGILNLSNNSDLSVVLSAGRFQTKAQTHPDSKNGRVPSRHGWLLHKPFAHLSCAFGAYLCCSQGANVIPPNGIPRLEALSSTSPLVLLRRVNKTSGVLSDVVKEPDTLTAAASKKRLLHSNNPSQRHRGLHSAKALKPSEIHIDALSQTFHGDYFLFCVRAHLNSRCGLLDGHHVGDGFDGDASQLRMNLWENGSMGAACVYVYIYTYMCAYELHVYIYVCVCIYIYICYMYVYVFFTYIHARTRSTPLQMPLGETLAASRKATASLRFTQAPSTDPQHRAPVAATLRCTAHEARKPPQR